MALMSRSSRNFLGAAVCAAGLMATPGLMTNAWAGEKILYTFPNSGDVGQAAGVIRDSSGNIYGTAETGGAYGGGGIFELIPSGNAYTESVLHNFCALSACADGQTPLDRLIMDTSGDLYGVTYAGGKYNGGSVFELVPNARHTSWKLVTLYSFCRKTNCADGNRPTFGLTYQGAQNGSLYDGTSPLFGNTYQGGAGSGVIYELTYLSGKTSRAEKVIHKFCKETCAAGQYPDGTPVLDSSGRIYGTASGGGTHGGDGLVFRLTFNTTKNRWGENVLYDFGSQTPDGLAPVGALLRDSSGNLFGMTAGGGAHGAGTAFELSSGTETVLYSFCSQSNCADGSNPNAGLTMDANGNLFGEVVNGGANGNSGVLFELSKGSYKTLYSFGGYQGDFVEPIGGVVLDSSGNIYGAALAGGTYNKGGVYEFSSGAR